jgi:hypothetical protein
MNLNNPLRQFIKDGLIGLVVVFFVFILLMIIAFAFGLYPFTLRSFWSLIQISFVFPRTFLSIANGIPNWHVFNSPMPLVILMAFLALGSSGQHFEKITSRASWVKPIIIVVMKSWLIGVILWPILLVLRVRFWVGSSDAIADSISIPLVFGIVGAIVGVLIGFLAGFILNPAKRLFRIIIGAVATICVAYIIGAGILLEQWLH